MSAKPHGETHDFTSLRDFKSRSSTATVTTELDTAAWSVEPNAATSVPPASVYSPPGDETPDPVVRHRPPLRRQASVTSQLPDAEALYDPGEEDIVADADSSQPRPASRGRSSLSTYHSPAPPSAVMAEDTFHMSTPVNEPEVRGFLTFSEQLSEMDKPVVEVPESARPGGVEAVADDVASESSASEADEDEREAGGDAPGGAKRRPMPLAKKLKKIKLFKDVKSDVVLQYWKQAVKQNIEKGVYKKAPSRQQIRKYVESVLQNKEVENREKVHEEVNFIIQHFSQRRCRAFCKRAPRVNERVRRALSRAGSSVTTDGTEYCVCGLARELHTREALTHPTDRWSTADSTELVWPWNFGNVDIPGHYNYLEMPGGSRKYVRLDDATTEPRAVWELLVKQWDFEVPNMVLSLCGGDITALQADTTLYRAFRDGILHTAVKTRAWVLTDGLHMGCSREVADIFQEDLKRSQWAEVEDHANIPLIGFPPWSVLADRATLMGIHVGSDEAVYNLNALKHSENALDPYHVCYLLADTGVSGRYREEPALRRRLEAYIKSKTTLAIFGTKDVTTPVVILVVGGDRLTLSKLHFATAAERQLSVVVVNGSGAIADMLADVYKALETRYPRSQRKQHGWSDDEERIMVECVAKYQKKGLIKDDKDELYIRETMKARHLMEVFGLSEGDERKLSRAILQAAFGSITEISGQLSLTLALDRVDIAQETIFTEARKFELRNCSELLQTALLTALTAGKTHFASLLIDQDCGGELNFEEFLSVRRLYTLHADNLNPSSIMGKVLRSLCRRDVYGAFMLGESELLPQVGRIIHLLMGNHYKLLYQHNGFRTVSDKPIPPCMSRHASEEAVWHLFLWAVLANKRDIAELFLFESSCKIGCALVAVKMFRELAHVAETLHESELVAHLRQNAEYFEDLAVETLDTLYEFSREEAYASLVAVLPFHWGRYVTPLSLADDAYAMRFMGHSCSQTFLNLVWMQYMDIDTPRWKLFPVFALLPFINIPLIVFDKHNLAFGSYRQELKQEIAEENAQLTGTNDHLPDPDATAMDNVSIASTVAASTSGDSPSGTARRSFLIKRRLRFTWFCLQNYYTAPINKFIFHCCSYVVFLGLFTHFLLTVLRPVEAAADVTALEWILIFWFFCMVVEELKQMSLKRSSGPLFNLRWTDFDPAWRSTWHWYERLMFVFHIHRLTNWLADRWNKVDALMILMFLASIICRFTVPAMDFGVVRIMFAITLIVFYFRILRLGYIMQDYGPRIITIKAMMGDMVQFMVIMFVFIFSFGIAFQALLDPNKPSSWSLLADVLWRPYWQMYGEIMTEDATTTMDRDIQPRPACTYNRTQAALEGREYCYDWMVPIMLAVFMLITNILLLNLLIAIFSQSFGEIEAEAKNIWRYHIYDLVHEYYHMVWLPPPANILIHLYNMAAWVLTWPRRWSYTLNEKRHRKEAEVEILQDAGGMGGDTSEKSQKKLAERIERETERRLRETCCSPWYYGPTQAEAQYINHFRQEEYQRSVDLEEKAYKRFLRTRQRNKQSDTKLLKMLDVQQQRLQLISTDLAGLKAGTTETSGPPVSPIKKVAGGHSGFALDENGGVSALRGDLSEVRTGLQQLNSRLDKLVISLQGQGNSFR